MNTQSVPGRLEALGHIAGMSRARFAAHFLATMKQTPFEYLALWRIGVAQSLLKKGEPLKTVAPSVVSECGRLNQVDFPVTWASHL